MEYIIYLTWDDDSQRWDAVNDDIPLALESGSIDALIERCRYAAPEMLKLNGNTETDIQLKFIAERKTCAFS